jgi:hypothetical protein
MMNGLGVGAAEVCVDAAAGADSVDFMTCSS